MEILKTWVGLGLHTKRYTKHDLRSYLYFVFQNTTKIILEPSRLEGPLLALRVYHFSLLPRKSRLQENSLQ